MIFACPKRVYSSILPQKQWVGGAHALFRLNRATSLIYIQSLAEGILTPHGRVRVGVIENPGNNQLGDNAAAAIASLIHALPKLKSLLLAGNILGSLASGQVAVDQVSMDMIFGAALGNWRDNPCDPNCSLYLLDPIGFSLVRAEKWCVCVCNPFPGYCKKGSMVNKPWQTIGVPLF